MRSLVCSLLALTVAFAAHPAHAQDPADDMMLRMETAMADAQAQASRPGDEALSCEALEAEMIAVTQDPAFQARVAENGVWAQGQIDQMNGLAGRARAQMGMSMILGIASAFIPGGGYGQMIAQRAIAAGQQAQTQQNMAQMMHMAEGMIPLMPQMFRGQRVYELAQAKQCAFVQQQTPETPQ
jgi:hypothetical protein